MKPYSNLPDESIKSVIEVLQQIIRLRNNEDVSDFTNLDKKLILGRKVGKVPTSSSDVVPGSDVIGDFNATASYLFILIDNSGTVEWRRVALSSF